MKALTIWQPWASLAAHGIKTIEIRSWPAPDGLVGQRIALHAAAKTPRLGDHELGRVFRAFSAKFECRALLRHGEGINPETHPLVLPLGRVVGSAVLDACVPILEGTDELAAAEPRPCIVVVNSRSSDWFGTATLYPPEDVGNGVAVDDQLPFGDFTPDRWAWLLSDAAPCSTRCPWCWDRRHVVEFVGPGSTRTTCPVCDGQGHCDPPQATGRQGIWNWTPAPDEATAAT